MNREWSACPVRAVPKSMLAKIIKNQQDPGFVPFSLPEIGRPNDRSNGVTLFVAPALESLRIEKEINEIIEKAPIFVPGVEDVLRSAHEEAANIIARAEE